MIELNLQEVEVVGGGLSDRLIDLIDALNRRRFVPHDPAPWIL